MRVTTSPYRDLWFIEKYKAADPRIFITVCKILLKKFEYSSFLAGMYSGFFFYDGFHKPEEIIKEFSGHIDLLAKLYILTFKNTSTICDLQGAFARALLRVDSTFVDAFAQHVAEMLRQHRGESVREQLISIFDEENAHSILDRIVKTTAAAYHTQLISGCKLNSSNSQGITPFPFDVYQVSLIPPMERECTPSSRGSSFGISH